MADLRCKCMPRFALALLADVMLSGKGKMKGKGKGKTKKPSGPLASLTPCQKGGLLVWL